VTPTQIHNELRSLYSAKASLSSIISTLEYELEEIQAKCKHKFKFYCHTHNDSVYKCDLCGKTEDR